MLMILKMHCDDVMLSMYMRGAVILLDIPGGEDIVVKEF